MGRLDLRDVYRDEDWTAKRYVAEGFPDRLLRTLADAPILDERDIDRGKNGASRYGPAGTGRSVRSQRRAA